MLVATTACQSWLVFETQCRLQYGEWYVELFKVHFVKGKIRSMNKISLNM